VLVAGALPLTPLGQLTTLPLVGWWGGYLSPRTPPYRRLRRLDPRAFGARCSALRSLFSSVYYPPIF